MENMKLKILGMVYKVTIKKFDEDEAFKRDSCDGYCNQYRKEIVICDVSTSEMWEHDTPEDIEAYMKETLRHEIVHAFLNESGLQSSTAVYENGWAKFEEMVDWIALQGPKIYNAWSLAGAL